MCDCSGTESHDELEVMRMNISPDGSSRSRLVRNQKHRDDQREEEKCWMTV